MYVAFWLKRVILLLPQTKTITLIKLFLNSMYLLHTNRFQLKLAFENGKNSHIRGRLCFDVNVLTKISKSWFRYMHIAYMHSGTGLRADLRIVPFMLKVDTQNKNKNSYHVELTRKTKTKNDYTNCHATLYLENPFSVRIACTKQASDKI